MLQRRLLTSGGRLVGCCGGNKRRRKHEEEQNMKKKKTRRKQGDSDLSAKSDLWLKLLRLYARSIPLSPDGHGAWWRPSVSSLVTGSVMLGALPAVTEVKLNSLVFLCSYTRCSLAPVTAACFFHWILTWHGSGYFTSLGEHSVLSIARQFQGLLQFHVLCLQRQEGTGALLIHPPGALEVLLPEHLWEKWGWFAVRVGHLALGDLD